MNLSAFGQMSLDSPKVSLIVFFAIAEPSIDRKLAHFKAFIKQKFPEFRRFARVFLGVHRQRSEEHTSELQSLMRISYAFFCLKKNTRRAINPCPRPAEHNRKARDTI